MLRSCVSSTASRLIVLAGLFLFSSFGASAAVYYQVTVDTSAFAGTSGFFDLQFNGGANADSATALVSSFISPGGSLDGAPSIDGSVTGTLPGPVSFENNADVNSYFQGFNYGSSFRFFLTLDGDAINAPSGGATSETGFFIYLYNSEVEGIGPMDPTFASSGYALIGLDGSISTVGAGPNPIVTFEQVDTVIPEPSTWMLFSGASAALLMFSRKRGASGSVRR